jgi:hypothetical protein
MECHTENHGGSLPRKLMWGQPPSAVRGAKRRHTSVERTFLSVAFVVDLEVEVDLMVSHPLRALGERGRPALIKVIASDWIAISRLMVRFATAKVKIAKL